MAKPRKKGSEPSTKQASNKNPPHDHRDGIAQDGSDGGDNGSHHPDVAVEQQRKRHHAQRERQGGKQEANGIADNDELLALRRKQHPARELGERGRLIVAEPCLIDGVGRRQPDREDHQQQPTQQTDRPERRRMDDVEGMLPRGVEAKFAPSAQLVKADRRQRARSTGSRRRADRVAG